MADEEVKQPEQETEEKTEEEVSEAEETAQKLPFPTAAIVREMKKNIDKSKMIKKEVKIGMNRFLGEVVKDVAKQLDKNPYAMLDYRMLQDAIAPYKKMKQMDREKERIATRMDAIIKDCEIMKEDLGEKFGEKKMEL